MRLDFWNCLSIIENLIESIIQKITKKCLELMCRSEILCTISTNFLFVQRVVHKWL